ncbi:MAG: EamA family transporter [Hyphomicrobiales bacterium]|nr:MAG: EamA family transporter [Hyphomicrobiales bacterium]
MLFWAGNIVLGRAIVGDIPPVLLAQIRWIGAALLLTPFALPHVRKNWQVIKSNVWLLGLLAFTGITIYNTMAYIGLQHTTALNGLLMQSFAPLMIGFWSLILFRDALSSWQIGGILLSLCGVGIILSAGSLNTLLSLSFNPGDIWVFSAFLFYALYSAMLRKRPKIHWLSFLWITISAGSLMLLPITVMEYMSGARMVVHAGSISAIIYVVLFPGLAAYICFNRGIELIGANRAGPFFHLIPLFGSTLAIVLLGETPQPYHGIGYVLILIGVLFSQRKKGVATG